MESRVLHAKICRVILPDYLKIISLSVKEKVKNLKKRRSRLSIVINIYSKGEYPANALSNFYPHKFGFDGVEVSCMEALLQSFKFANWDEQKRMCQLAAKQAKLLGSTQNWQSSGYLYWKGQAYRRYSREYRQLLSRAYDALLCNPDFCQALHDSGHCLLIHTIGKLLPQNTCLTAWEFCVLLVRKRRGLRRKDTENNQNR